MPETIITPEEVTSLDLGSIADADMVGEEALASICQGAGRRVEGYLDRALIAASYQTRALSWRHRRYYQLSNGLSVYQAAVPAWPVLQAPEEVSFGPEEDELLSSSEAIASGETDVAYYAGYRREGQTLEDLQQELPNLTTLPAVLPYDIREVALVIALFRLSKREGGSYGTERIMQEMGGMPVTIETAEPEFETRVLAQIQHHRRILV